MANKVLVVLVVIALLLWVVIQQRDQNLHMVSANDNTDKGSVDTSSKTAEQIKKPSEQKIQNKSDEPILSPDKEHRLGFLKQELATTVFSDDLFVEASVHSQLMMYCEIFKAGFIRTELKGKIKNKTWEDAYKKHCDAQRTLRPHLLVSMVSSELLDWLPSTSFMGQKFKTLLSLNGDQGEELAIEMIRLAVRNKEAHWLLLVGQSQGMLNAFNYQEWLGTNNPQYNRQIIQLAQQQLICEWDPGNLCGPYSSLMAQNCWQTPSDCGIPYSEWFEKNHMPGIKKDVALVVNRLRAYARGGDIE